RGQDVGQRESPPLLRGGDGIVDPGAAPSVPRIGTFIVVEFPGPGPVERLRQGHLLEPITAPGFRELDRDGVIVLAARFEGEAERLAPAQSGFAGEARARNDLAGMRDADPGGTCRPIEPGDAGVDVIARLGRGTPYDDAVDLRLRLPGPVIVPVE